MFNPPFSNSPDFWFGHSTQAGSSFSRQNLVMATAPLYEESSKNSSLSEFSVNDDISMKHALILTSLNVQAHHGQRESVTSASKK